MATRSSCLVFVHGCSVDSGPCTVSWQIKDGGDGDQAADGTYKQWPPGPTFTPTQLHVLPHCDEAQNGGGGGEWKGAMVAFSCLRDK